MQLSNFQFLIDWFLFVQLMQVEGIFYVNNNLEDLMFEELRNSCSQGLVGGFLPGMKQIANVAALPGNYNLISSLFYNYKWNMYLNHRIISSYITLF